MERLSSSLQRQYETLVQSFGNRESRTFSWDEAITTLGLPQGTVGELLSTLERTGYLFKKIEVIDRRTRSYRLMDVAQARRLDERLETWRKTAAQQTPPLAEAIDRFWAQVCAVLKPKVDLSAVPQQPARLAVEYAAGKVKLSDLRVVRATDIRHLEKDDQDYVGEMLKLFDSSSNAYRSITNVLLEYEKLRRDLTAGAYDLAVENYAAVDGMPLELPKRAANKALCPVCRRFRQSHTALALITGNPKMDSIFQTYRGSPSTRTSMRVCGYCFTAGWVDLPTALVTKAGQSVNKGREYLFITTPLSRDDIQHLLNVIAKRDGEMAPAEEEEEKPGPMEEPKETEEVPEDEEAEEDLSVAALNQSLKKKYGIEGLGGLAVLGLSARRLSEMRGFVLPSANALQRVVAVRVPVERLVGEDKVSGAVRRELVKATMYDFWQITGGSLHYNRIIDAPFSVDGQPIELEEMHRANVAYHITDRYARVGKYRQLNSGLFMLLLSSPREAATNILRVRHRDRGGRFAPGNEKVKEVIALVESIASQDDWKFQMGLRIAELLVTNDLAKGARGFWKSKAEQYTGVDLVKWFQRIKMIRDPDSARVWGTSLINGYRREHKGKGPNAEVVGQILALVEDIINVCQEHDYPLRNFARDIANMDYYLLFYYNQRQAAQDKSEEEAQ